MKAVHTYATRQAAEYMMLRLRSENITSFVQSDDCGGMRPHLSLSQGAKLMVHAMDYEKAECMIMAIGNPFEGVQISNFLNP
jgi:hypothetical protein